MFTIFLWSTRNKRTSFWPDLTSNRLIANWKERMNIIQLLKNELILSFISLPGLIVNSKNWCLQIVVLEETLESPLGCKEIQAVYPKGNQSWIFIGRTDAEAETPILQLPDVKSWLIWKDPDAGKDWKQEEKGTTEMVGWHHQFDGHEFEQALGDGEGREIWHAAFHGVTTSQTRLGDWTEHSIIVK